MIVACDGPVRGTGLWACSKRTPRAARASSVGVPAFAAPYTPTWSARRVSIVTRSRFGAAGRRSVAHHPRAVATIMTAATTIQRPDGRRGTDGDAAAATCPLFFFEFFEPIRAF